MGVEFNILYIYDNFFNTISPQLDLYHVYAVLICLQPLTK